MINKLSYISIVIFPVCMIYVGLNKLISVRGSPPIIRSTNTNKNV